MAIVRWAMRASVQERHRNSLARGTTPGISRPILRGAHAQDDEDEQSAEKHRHPCHKGKSIQVGFPGGMINRVRQGAEIGRCEFLD